MNYPFYVPDVEEYEKEVKKYFVIENVYHTKDVGGKDFPIYILRKK